MATDRGDHELQRSRTADESPKRLPLAMSVLGPLSAEVHGGPLALSGMRRRAILLRLIMESTHCVPLERLAEDAWGGNPPPGSASTLRSHLSSLRKVLGPDRVFSRQGSAVLALDTDELDAERFETSLNQARLAVVRSDDRQAERLFESALGLWRGNAYSDVAGMPWALPETARLEEQRIEALEGMLDVQLKLGDCSRVVASAEQAVREHPLREHLWATLITALYRSGRQAEALRAYERVRVQLAEELGIEPSHELRNLERAVLEQDASLDRWAPQRQGEVKPPLQVGTVESGNSAGAGSDDNTIASQESDLTWIATSGRARVVGRGPELETAIRARDRSHQGRQVLLVVTGEPGIGKTTLVSELAIASEAKGDLILYGRCNEQPLSPYEIFQSAIGRALRYPIGKLALERVGHLRSSLSQLFPEVVELDPPLPRDTRQSAEAERFRMFEAVAMLIRSIATLRPTVLVFEDIQWADAASIALLNLTLRSNPEVPLLVVATIRSTDSGPAPWLSEDLVSIKRVIDVDRIDLDGLDPALSLELYAEATGLIIGSGAVSGERLHVYTGGNPYFLQEIGAEVTRTMTSISDLLDDGDALHWKVTVPERLRELVTWRLASLSVRSCELFRVASLLGLQFSASVLIAVSDSEDDVLVALDEGLAAGIVSEVGGGSGDYRFVHDLIRHSLETSLGSARRSRAHLRIAQVLEGQHGLSRVSAGEIARHYVQGIAAGATDRARLFCRVAGEAAFEQVAFERAAMYFQQALDISERYFPDDAQGECEIVLRLAHTKVKAGHLVVADELFKRAFEECRRLGRWDLAGSAALGYGGVLPAGVEPNPAAQEMLRSVLAEIGVGDHLQRALILGRLAQWGHFSEPREARATLTGDAIQIADRLGDPATMATVLEYRYWALSGPDELDRQLSDARKIREIGEGLGESELVLRGMKCELHAEFELGDFAAANRRAQVMRQLATEVGQPEFVRLGFMWDSLVAGIQGRFDDAEQAAIRAYAIFRESGHSQTDAIAVGLSLTWLWLQGRMGEMKPLLEAGRTGRSSLGERALAAWTAVESGELEDARSIVANLSKGEVSAQDRNFHWWFTMAGLSQAVSALEDRGWAQHLYGLMLPYRTHNCRVGQATFLGSVSYHLGVLARVAGDLETATAHLQEALERHLLMGATPFVELTLCELERAATGVSG